MHFYLKQNVHSSDAKYKSQILYFNSSKCSINTRAEKEIRDPNLPNGKYMDDDDMCKL